MGRMMIGSIETEAAGESLDGQPRATSLHVLVLLLLMTYRSTSGKVNPSRELLARRAKSSVQTITRVLADLKEWELISCSERIPVEYRLGPKLHAVLYKLYVRVGRRSGWTELLSASGG